MRSAPFDLLKRCILGVTFSARALSTVLPAHSSGKVDFRRDVQPLLRQYCIECHGPAQQMHGFRLDRRRAALWGGTITVIVPGNSAGSRLCLKLLGNQYGPQMPPTGPLTPEQIGVIKAWIDQGAEWPDDLAGDTPPALPDPKAARIMQALRDGDQEALKSLVGKEPNIGNLKGPGGTTPLMQAVLCGDLETVRLLLRQGADPSIRNEAGATALIWAVDDPEKTRLLLDAGADVNARSGDGRTPLLIAAERFGNESVVKLLLDRAFQLLGLAWAGVKTDREMITKAARALIAEQQPDGGWSQLPALASDAYATGQALVALRHSGAIAMTDPVYRRGISFLLKTQLADGSWYIRRRAVPLQPYFEGGFPHGPDQWISVAGTNWATMALALAITPPGNRIRNNRAWD